MVLTPGTRLGPYEIIAPLGAGGMGEVYRAHDPRLGREVAVKVMLEAVAGDPDRQKRFEGEARAAGALNHPNIVTLHDVGIADGIPYIVTEVLEGETLRDLITRGALAPARAVEIIVQAAQGLAAAHGKGIVHRDLKPENLFVLPDGRVKILDFGIAKLTRPEGTEIMETTPMFGAMTQAGTILGTVSYMAPEQLRDRTVDHRADIFAMGAILYEVLSGHVAFEGETAADRVSAILSAEPAPLLPEIESSLPGIGGLIRRCLEKRPESRFESARDLAYALEILEDAARSRVDPSSTPLQTASAEAPGLDIQQLTFREGMVSSARFAPDGTTVIYHASWEGGPGEMYLTRTDNLDYRPLNLGSAELLGVSAGAELAVGLDPRDMGGFVRLHTLARVSMLGGVPRELARDVFMADWGPGGKSIAAIREVEGKFRIEYPLGKVLYETNGWLSNVRVSPDGRHLAFFEHPIGGDNGGDLMVLEPGGDARRLAARLDTAAALAWHPSGTEIWFAAVLSDASQGMIWSTTLDGQIRRVHQTLGWPEVHDFSARGDALVTRTRPRLRLQAGSRAGGGNDRIELSWLDWSLARDISKDGSLVLFDETGPGIRHGAAVFTRSTDGSPAVRIADGVAMAFMPDGEHVLTFDQDRSTRRLSVHPLGVGEPLYIDIGDLQCHFARPFPDGKSVVAVANRPNEPFGLCRIEIPSGSCVSLTKHPIAMAYPIPSPRGDMISMRQADGYFALYPVDGGPPTRIPTLKTDERPCGWAPDGEAIYVFQRGKIPGRVDRIDLATARREPWLEIEPMTRSGTTGFISVVLTSDGERYVASFGQFVNDLFLVGGLR
jgi:eukaryotic-like serine/threonine-protein kinase